MVWPWIISIGGLMDGDLKEFTCIWWIKSNLNSWMVTEFAVVHFLVISSWKAPTQSFGQKKNKDI